MIWSWLGGGNWNAYRDEEGRIFEDAHQNGQSSINVSLKGHQYKIDLEAMEQVNVETGKRRSMRRGPVQANSDTSCSSASQSVSESDFEDGQLEATCSIASEEEKASIHAQLAKWDKSRGPMPQVNEIYKIHASAAVKESFWRTCKEIGNVKVYGWGRNPANQQRRFHGTRQVCRFRGDPCEAPGCSACGIIREGFNLQYLSTGSGNRGLYGEGHYSTSKPATAAGYGGESNVLMVVWVAAGHAEKVRRRTSAPIADGYHSRVVMKDTGVDEILVPRNEQMLPAFLIQFA